MTPSRSDLDAESWAFALRFYGKPGMMDACLRFQEEAGVDVMLLLIAMFAATKLRLVLSSDQVRELDAVCRPWREQIVTPLRAVRRTLKVGPLPAPDEASEALRSQIKANELAAERLQNCLLVDHLPLDLPRRESVTAEDLRAVLRSVATLALEGEDKSLGQDLQSSMDAIVGAAMQEASQQAIR
jgi:uncharacterized protein (TIGR02444 family)